MHRVIYNNGQIRTVEFRSRKAAFDFFGTTARSRTTESAVLQRSVGHCHIETGYSAWQEIATMHVTPENEVALAT